MNYFHPEVQEIQPFKKLKPKTLTDAVVTALVLPVFMHGLLPTYRHIY